jgi:ATP-independent RNA helicase DbpA
VTTPPDTASVEGAFGALLPALRASLDALGIRAPTPIQERCIPLLLAGRDVLGLAQTGSGKTFAYGLPLLQSLDLSSSTRHLQALVLCPTRELAAQVAAELRRAARALGGVRVLEVCGGQPGWAQRKALEEGAHVVVGTPGRCLDMFERDVARPEDLRVVVLDEADRMLDLGFREQVERILSGLPIARQTALFSATFPERVMDLSARWQRDPERVIVESEGPAITHRAHPVDEDGRIAGLLAVLRAHQPASALVFANTREVVKQASTALIEAGARAAALHGDLEQPDRDAVMAQLRNGSLRVVVATDVAARGIDVSGLDLVVNLELPGKPDVYVHRAGRTGRAQAQGLAIALVSPRERGRLAWIGQETGVAFVEELLPTGDPAATLDAPMRTLWFGAGRKDKLRPGDVLGALTGAREAGGAGLSGTAIGRIEIQERVSYVAIARDHARDALDALRAGKVKGRRVAVGRLT